MNQAMPAYLDNNATTPLDERVLEAMLPYFTRKFGNASSRHHLYGREASDAVALAREQVAELIHAEPSEIVFTSGATEAVNLAIKGVFERYRSRGNHIITCATEHQAVLSACKSLESKGAVVTVLPVDGQGRIDLGLLEAAITEQTILICLMYANNETGVIHPVREIHAIARRHGILFFSDAAQAAGKIPVDVRTAGADLLSLTAHKIYGPKGIGALYIRRKDPRVTLAAQMDGGGQEKGFRSGTLNVPGITGFGKAAALCMAEMQQESTRLAQWRNHLEDMLRDIPEVGFNGSGAPRLPHVSSIFIRHTESAALLSELSSYMALSGGSACSSGTGEPSHVLKAMIGKDADTGQNAVLRISLGRFTTEGEIAFVLPVIREAIYRLRRHSPLWHTISKN